MNYDDIQIPVAGWSGTGWIQGYDTIAVQNHGSRRLAPTQSQHEYM